MNPKQPSGRGAAQPSKETGALVIPLRRVDGRRTAAGGEPSRLEEGMAAMARLLAEAWAC